MKIKYTLTNGTLKKQFTEKIEIIETAHSMGYLVMLHYGHEFAQEYHNGTWWIEKREAI